MKNKNFKTLLCINAILLSIGCTTSPSNFTSIKNEFNQPQNGVMVVAHRGCWRLAPENSVAAVKECIQMGVDMVEIDVQRTKDGQLVSIHDKTIDRTTNSEGKVKDLTLSEIKSLSLKEFSGGDEAKVTSEKIPTLKEILLVAKGHVMINIDAKGDIREQAFLEAKELGMLDHILIKDRLTEPTPALQESFYYKKTNFMPIIKEKDGSLTSIIRNFKSEPQQAYEVIFKTEDGIKNACTAAYNQGARCWVNTLWESLSPGYSDDRNLENPDKYWGTLINEFGVDMIQTDRPQLLINYLSNKS